MPRQLVLISLSILLFSSVSFGKNKGVFLTEIVSSTDTHTDPNEIVTLTGKLISEVAFDFVNIEWKFEGDIELVSGQVKTRINDIKVDQPASEEINVRIKNLEGAKIIFWVYKDVDDSRIGSIKKYIPKAKSVEIKDIDKAKAKAFRIKSKKIFH